MDINLGHREEELLEAQSHLIKLLFNYIDSKCLQTALQLGIPGIIHSHGRPITLSELVSALRIDPSKSVFLYRLMRLLVHSGIFASTKPFINGKIKQEEEEEEEEEGGGGEGYDLTPTSRLLLEENVPNLVPYTRSTFHPILTNPWQLLGDWFYRKEVTPFEAAFGMNFWEYGNQNPEYSKLFHEAMVSESGMINMVIKDCKAVFEGVNSFVDVGGGTGGVARIISEALPHVNCTVLDLPHVVADIPDSKNLKFVGGDMFQSIPSADVILLKIVLHGFSDEDCVKVLKNCREAISGKGKEGKVIVIDIVINEKKDKRELTEAKLYFDLMMMVSAPGRERKEKEWKKLFLEAGFSHYKITPIFGIRSLIEVYP